MMTSTSSRRDQIFPHHPHLHTAHHYDSNISAPSAALPPLEPAHQSINHQLFTNALSQLSQSRDLCMNNEQQQIFFDASKPSLRAQNSTPTPDHLGAGFRQDSLLPPNTAFADHSWMYQLSMGGPTVQAQGLTRARSGHQRTPSASTVASNGPASPYTHTHSNPQIANTDYAPNSPAHFNDQSGLFPKALPTTTHTPTDSSFAGSGYISSQLAQSAAHQAMKGFAIDHHNGEDSAPDLYSSRQSMSSYGHNSPATPQSGAGETTQQNGQYSIPQTGEWAEKQACNDNHLLLEAEYAHPHPDVQLFRTDSQAYQDELYNPEVPLPTSVPAQSNTSKPASTYLSPHRGLMEQRLQTANMTRSQSPMSAVSRDRSPFRNGSPLAPTGATGDWQTRAMQTASGMRQHQKEQVDQAELAAHKPTLRREPTKTISPKDALLDYNEPEQPSLFRDSVPSGYKTYNGGTEMWPSSDYQPGGSFGALQTPGQQQSWSNFRATSADNVSATDAMSYVNLPPQDQAQLQNGSYLNSYLGNSKMASDTTEPNPEFPAHLTTMESSISENGPMPSSQDSNGNTSALQRPQDTRAATGTYTCTYHGCSQRFDSANTLQKHKRDFHRTQQQQRETSGTASSPAGSESPRSSESPDPSTAGMTSAAIMARNSQAGPHKCTRINPSTNKPCNTIFSRPYDLTRHEDTIHNNRKQKVRCHLCREEKTFSRNDALTRHMRVVHPEVEAYGKKPRKGD